MNNSNTYNLATTLLLSIASLWILYGLMVASVFVVFSAISHFFPLFMDIGLTLIYVLMLICIILSIILCLSIVLKKDLLPLLSIRYILMMYLAPVSKSIAKRTWFDSEKVIRTYIDLNNKFLINKSKNMQLSNILLLLPHCVQLNTCGIKLTYDIRNCKMCGKCVIAGLIELSDKFNVSISVANGGTMARKQVAEVKPSMVLAVACERDLLSGIRDTLPLNVLGVLNSRPNGHCVNTTVNIDSINELMQQLKG